MRHIVHYRLSDGEIVAQHRTLSDQIVPVGCGTLEVADTVNFFSPGDYCVDLKSQTMVAKTADQLAAIRAGALEQHVRSSIASELARTDCTQLADHPAAPQRAAWATYRQALRDLSKKGLTGDQQLAAWPPAPDGRHSPVFLGDIPKPAPPALPTNSQS